MRMAARSIWIGAAILFASGCANGEASPNWRTEAMNAAADMLEQEYINAETGAALASYLRANQQDYKEINDKAEFAKRLTLDLYEIANDKHLRISFEPENAVEADNNEENEDERPHITYCRTTPIAFRQENDVGIVTIPRFFGEAEYYAEIDAAMTEAADSAALILDLRNNCGGGPMQVKYVSTYFFAEKTHLVSTEMRGEPISERWTLDEVPGPRFLDKPLYIVTNQKTFSAGESFTFGMKTTGRAIVVGEATGGGGHFGDTVRLSSEFSMFLPVGRTFDPRTSEGWEATGIAPDIAADPDAAVAAAVSHFMQARAD